jgi:hypothetical protein
MKRWQISRLVIEFGYMGSVATETFYDLEYNNEEEYVELLENKLNEIFVKLPLNNEGKKYMTFIDPSTKEEMYCVDKDDEWMAWIRSIYKDSVGYERVSDDWD